MKSATTTRTRDPERSRADILRAARAEFVEKGPAGARTQAIARRAGVPQGLLFHYFQNKDGLFNAVVHDSFRTYFESTVELLEGASGETAGPRLLETAIRMYFEFLRDNPHVPRLQAWWVAAGRWRDGFPGLDDALCERPMELGSERIRQAQAAGLIKPGLDPESVIRLFLDLCMHWHQTWESVAAERGVDASDPDAVDAMHRERLEHIVDVMLGGVLTEKGSAARQGATS